ncbi:methyl-accepting chemotaxis sensory transducer with GAF sensor [Rippkaea orientalis PCC 8801]|uniref:Methyl-accepting chemotaxis sensory transducer with GAF sensor n=2 Tax=Rippkaea TaxID=2546365 RepID=B7JZA0_RIPO1|nr:methyl-accepting chemotaxis sensory transducer with GAF sensor [Rippkaea orientalis PCC 8801]
MKTPMKPENIQQLSVNNKQFSGVKISPPPPLSPSPPLSTPDSRRQSRSLWQRFSDLPITQKTQLATALMVVAIGGCIGVGYASLVSSLRSQLRYQTQSQLAVTALNYQRDLEDMGLDFITQADNPTIINAAVNSAKGKPLSPELRNRLKSILDSELKIRKLEYATLVGNDGRIIVNANADRAGQVFEPKKLVNQVFKNPQQLRTSEIVPWLELTLEKPLLPEGFSSQDALIRYTITPVKLPGSQKVIGALVSGDIVNRNLSIVEQTVEAFQSVGYSAIYLHQTSTGTFSLATSFGKTEMRQPTMNLDWVPPSLLAEAVAAKGKAVSGRGLVGKRNYTFSAKALPNSQGNTVAVLVFGDPELALEQIIKQNLLLQLGLSGVALVIILGVTWAIAKAITHPIKRLEEVTEAFAQGNYQVRANDRNQDELGRLAKAFNRMAESIVTNNDRIRQETELFRFLSELQTQDFTLSVTDGENTLKPLENWFSRALAKARQLLGADRLLIYRFAPDGRGTIDYESFGSGVSSTLNQQIGDACIPAELLEAYRVDRVAMINNLSEVTLDPDHLELLTRLGVQANLVIPILNQGNLFGLLIAHQCFSPRQWEERDINFLKQLSTQFQVILNRLSLSHQQAIDARLAQSLKTITQRISGAFDLENLFAIAVNNCREALATDRVIVYCFDENWKGTVTAESVRAGYPQALGALIADPCFAERYVEKYRQGRVQATTNIQTAGLTQCHLQQLEPFGVKANLVAPIVVSEQLYGLLIAHHCESPRYWDQSAIDFMTQVAIQVGVALERANLLNEQVENLEQQRQAKERLQQQALALLMQVEPISRGDLTVRAKVTPDEIGTIADSYNATVQNLRRIVQQVQQASHQLSTTSDKNELSIQSLASEALRQVEEIAQASQKLQAMSDSIKTVAHNAQNTLEAFSQASQTVEEGEMVINQTVEGMMSIRETVTQAAEKVQHLSSASEQISKAVSLISRFAAQTHLLALKASIEAARAGEEGRGFAVIADEVRTLAAQSAEATAEIEALVSNIQGETKEVAQAMTTGREQVMIGSNLVEQTRHSLNQMVSTSEQIQQLVKSISQAAIAQSEASETVTQVMEEVSAIAHHTSSSAKSVSNSFKDLLTVAHELQTSVDQFKVN